MPVTTWPVTTRPVGHGLNGVNSTEKPNRLENHISMNSTSLFTFWLPNIAMVFFSFLLTKSLQPEFQPTGLQKPSAWFSQCLTMYFCSTGAAWSGVWWATRKKSSG